MATSRASIESSRESIESRRASMRRMLSVLRAMFSELRATSSRRCTALMASQPQNARTAARAAPGKISWTRTRTAPGVLKNVENAESACAIPHTMPPARPPMARLKRHPTPAASKSPISLLPPARLHQPRPPAGRRLKFAGGGGVWNNPPRKNFSPTQQPEETVRWMTINARR